MSEVRYSWDKTFMEMARVISRRSPDPDKQVGAIIVSKNNIILGAGYNALPRGFDQQIFKWRKNADFLKNKHTYVVHAEANAIYNASQSVKGAIIYCTLQPCNECAKAIIQNGISEVVFDESKEKDYTKAATLMLRGVKIKLRQYNDNFKETN